MSMEIHDHIFTRNLTIVDADGNPRIHLGTNPDDGNALIILLGDNGKQRLCLAAGREPTVGGFSAISIYDARGVRRVWIGQPDIGQSQVLFYDEFGSLLDNMPPAEEEEPRNGNGDGKS